MLAVVRLIFEGMRKLAPFSMNHIKLLINASRQAQATTCPVIGVKHGTVSVICETVDILVPLLEEVSIMSYPPREWWKAEEGLRSSSDMSIAIPRILSFSYVLAAFPSGRVKPR